MSEFENSDEQQKNAAARMEYLKIGATGYVPRSGDTIDPPGIWTVSEVDENDVVTLTRPDGASKRGPAAEYIAFQKTQEEIQKALNPPEKLLPAGDDEASIDTTPRAHLIDRISAGLDMSAMTPESDEPFQAGVAEGIGSQALDAVGVDEPAAQAESAEPQENDENAEAENDEVKKLSQDLVEVVTPTERVIREYVDAAPGMLDTVDRRVGELQTSLLHVQHGNMDKQRFMQELDQAMYDLADAIRGFGEVAEGSLSPVLNRFMGEFDDIRAKARSIEAEAADVFKRELRETDTWLNEARDATRVLGNTAGECQGYVRQLDSLANDLRYNSYGIEATFGQIDQTLRLLSDANSASRTASLRLDEAQQRARSQLGKING